MKKTGTCFIVLGDTYYGSLKGAGCENSGKAGIDMSNYPVGARHNTGELQQKSLCQIPSRFSLEMTNRGWILRNEIIWKKPNCMPSSAKDRFTVDFEKLFMFVKNKKYYFETQYVPYSEEFLQDKRIQKIKTQELEHNEWKDYEGTKAQNPCETRDRILKGVDIEKGRNKRCVWEINTQQFPEAHFATYPEKLCETPIKAGCPKSGIVLDPFHGSGTTGKVARKLGRKYIGIDLKEEYLKMSLDTRLSEMYLDI